MLVNRFCRYAKIPKTASTHLAARSTTTTPSEPSSTSSTVNPKDVAHHGSLATNWWDTNSPMAPLLSLNALRVPFIRDGLVATKNIPQDKIKTIRVLEGIDILEVGCGGGFLTESLARLHANVTGIDPGKDVIRAAEAHVCQSSPDLVERIRYKAETIEDHARENLNRYDAVVMSEVVEHVENVPKFVAAAVDTVKPGGSIFITTPNRTRIMCATGVFLAENVFNLVPQGTHDWNKFVTPLEMQRILESLNCSTVLVNGFFYEMWRNTWTWVPTDKFCYALQAIKRAESAPDKTE